MTVTIEGGYRTTDVNTDGGILFGIPVQSSGLETLSSNHNFVMASYTPAVGTYCNSQNSGKGNGTSATSGSDFHNIVAIPVENQADGRGLTCRIQASNSGSSAYNLRLKCGSVTGSSVSIAAGATHAGITLTCASVPTGAPFAAVVQCNTGSESSAEVVKVQSAVWRWTRLTGTISDSPTASGFVWSQISDHQPTEPLTVEQFNRFRGGPRVAFEAFPQTVSSYVASMYRNEGFLSSDYNFGGYLVILKRRQAVKVRFRIIGKGHKVKITVPGVNTGTPATDYEVNFSHSESDNLVEMNPSSISVDTTNEIDLSDHPQQLVCPFYIKGNTGASEYAKVFSIQAVMQ